MPQTDFNGDGRSDILWLLDETVSVGNWLATPQGDFTVNEASIVTLNIMHYFELHAFGDFNGDGRTDLIFEVDQSGGFTIWFTAADGTQPGAILTTYGFGMTDPNWSIAGVGDFNGDGIDDLLWRHANGTIGTWLGTGEESGAPFTINTPSIIGVPNDWRVAGVGDFDGDGRDDIVWQSTNGLIGTWLGEDDGTFMINESSLTRMSALVAAVGDFNGDGRDDIVTLDGWSAYWVILSDPGGGLTYNDSPPAADGYDWGIHAVGDYDGDRIDDLLVRTSSGSLSYWRGGLNDGYGFDASGLIYGVPNEWQIADRLL